MLLLLLQKALQLAAEQPSEVSEASLQSRSKAKQEESWPVGLATSVCQQVRPCLRNSVQGTPAQDPLYDTPVQKHAIACMPDHTLEAPVTAETTRPQVRLVPTVTGWHQISLLRLSLSSAAAWLFPP